jgi:predicted N-acetyltransferase YhbS
MQKEYTFRRGDEAADTQRLEELFNQVFAPSPVGKLAATVTHHMPGMQPQNWFIAEKSRDEPVAAFALVPWTLEWEGVTLKVAEMAIVGTSKEHRGQDLQRRLNLNFDHVLQEEGYDLAIIQGIPGFYGQFGYHYALPLENHVNMPLHAIGEANTAYAFGLATTDDIAFLLQQDAEYRAAFSLAAQRNAEVWRYMLGPSRDTEYGSEFWLLQKEGECFYFRVPKDGFGTGLIVSEISENISAQAMQALLIFCKEKALERDKPYIRFNLHNDTNPGKLLRGLGAQTGKPYAWQVKIPDAARLLKKATPVLENRLASSPFAGLSAKLRLDFFRYRLDLVWNDGRLVSVETASGDAEHSFCLNDNLLAALCLGHRTWEDLRHIQPDIFPAGGQGGSLVEALFVKKPAWIHQQY